MGPYYLTHPVTFLMWKKNRVYAEETRDFQQSVDVYFFDTRTCLKEFFPRPRESNPRPYRRKASGQTTSNYRTAIYVLVSALIFCGLCLITYFVPLAFPLIYIYIYVNESKLGIYTVLIILEACRRNKHPQPSNSS